MSAYQQLLVDEYPPFSFGRRVSTAVVVWCSAFGLVVFGILGALILIAAFAAMENRPQGQLA